MVASPLRAWLLTLGPQGPRHQNQLVAVKQANQSSAKSLIPKVEAWRGNFC